jgi:hypothetical protein
MKRLVPKESSVKKASRTLLFLATLCAVALTAVAAVTQARVTNSAMEGVYIEGVVSLRGIPFMAAPLGMPRWKVTQSPSAGENFSYGAKWYVINEESRLMRGGAVVVSITYRIFLRHS